MESGTHSTAPPNQAHHEHAHMGADIPGRRHALHCLLCWGIPAKHALQCRQQVEGRRAQVEVGAAGAEVNQLLAPRDRAPPTGILAAWGRQHGAVGGGCGDDVDDGHGIGAWMRRR